MNASDAVRLTLLAAIWGASFLFLRVATPEFGPFALITVRIGGAALLLLPVLLRAAHRSLLVTHAGPLLVQGFFNSALPFTLLAWATLSLEAGFTSLLNASTPIFAALIGGLWLGIPLLRSQVLGLVLGLAGIAVLVAGRLSFRDGGSGGAILAVLAAACSYGVAAHYAKVRFAGVSAIGVSAGSLLASTILLLPFGIIFWPDSMPGAPAVASAAILATICTALAFILFFDILSRTGATAAATVTFLIPVFGVLWGAAFLAEQISARIVLGMAIALVGTALVLKLLPARKRPPTPGHPARP